jgi:DeoR/GlpR family transcriptional regulator of sugar metabolism
MFSVERQSIILEKLEGDGKVDVSGLSELFGISRETIRRDLRNMERNRILKRTHGGAVPLEGRTGRGNEYPLLVRSAHKNEEKQNICRRAACLMKDGDTIFIDNSSTTVAIPRYIAQDMKLTIITNSIQLILEVGKQRNEKLTVICIGGVLNIKNFSVTGILSREFSQNFFPDIAFMSCRGLHETMGMTDGSVLEIEVKKDIMSRSSKFVLMADHTKFGQIGAVFMGSLDKIDCVITDKKINPQKLQMFENLPTQVLIAE